MQPMTIEDAQDIVESKCAAEGCWHYSMSGYIYCVCCLHGKCNTMSTEEQKQYRKAKRHLAGKE